MSVYFIIFCLENYLHKMARLEFSIKTKVQGTCDGMSFVALTAYVTQDSTTITDRLFLSVMTISLTSHKTAQRSQTGWSYQLWPYHLRHTRQHNDHRQVVPISFDHITYVTQDSTTITDRLILSVMTISLTSHKTAQRSQTGWSLIVAVLCDVSDMVITDRNNLSVIVVLSCVT